MITFYNFNLFTNFNKHNIIYSVSIKQICPVSNDTKYHQLYLKIIRTIISDVVVISHEYTKQICHIFWSKVSLDPGGLNPGPFHLESLTLPSESPCFGRDWACLSEKVINKWRIVTHHLWMAPKNIYPITKQYELKWILNQLGSQEVRSIRMSTNYVSRQCCERANIVVDLNQNGNASTAYSNG